MAVTAAPAPAVPAGDAPATSSWVAERLRQAAVLLAAQGASPFRVSAYRRAAEAVEQLDVDLRSTADTGGRTALDAIPGIGPSIAGAIAEMLATGRWSFLERLKGDADPEALFCSVPGIGPALAQQIHENLHLDSLEELEQAAHDGRLEQLHGFGARRAAMVRNALSALLARLRPPASPPTEEPGVAELLDVDREYRDKAARDLLPRIAPKRFNPAHDAWLPVLHTERGSWHFTAFYSNTALAHRLGRTGDWVIVYFHRDTRPEGRRTIVTETAGDARGRRVVRGREAACRALAMPQGQAGTAVPAWEVAGTRGYCYLRVLPPTSASVVRTAGAGGGTCRRAGAGARACAQSRYADDNDHLHGAGPAGLFATHPPTEERIARSQAMAGLTSPWAANTRWR